MLGSLRHGTNRICLTFYQCPLKKRKFPLGGRALRFKSKHYFLWVSEQKWNFPFCALDEKVNLPTPSITYFPAMVTEPVFIAFVGRHKMIAKSNKNFSFFKKDRWSVSWHSQFAQLFHFKPDITPCRCASLFMIGNLSPRPHLFWTAGA